MANNTINLTTTWNGDTKGKGHIKANFLETDIALPESFGGTGEGAEPKEILITSATACFTMVLTSMLKMKKIPVNDIQVDTQSKGSKEGFSIVHDTHISLMNDATEEQVQEAQKLITIAEDNCEVGNMLKKAGVKIEAQGSASIA